MFARFLRPLPLLALLALPLPAQERGARIAEALRQGDRAAAELLVAEERELPRRALFEAALQPLRERPAAMLSVAQRFPTHAVAGTALTSGLAAVLVLQRRWPGDLPPLPELLEELGDETWDTSDDRSRDETLAVVVPQLLAAARREDGERPEAASATTLRRLARLCACTAAFTEPTPVASREAWPVPRPLADDLQVSVWRLGDAAPTGLDLIAVLERDCTRRWWIKQQDPPCELQSPGDGRWLVEVQSMATPWRSLRVVDVGSLAATVLTDEGALVFAAHDGGLRAFDEDITWSGWQHHTQRPGTVRGGHGLWADPGAGSFTVQARRGDERARVDVHVPSVKSSGRQFGRPREWALAHWQFDRPIHRPGEVLHGRVVVRSVQWQGEGLAAVPTTAVANDGWVPLRCKWPGGSVTTQQIALDAHGHATFSLPIPAAVPPCDVAIELGPLANGATLTTVATSIAMFRRPAMVATLDGPRRAVVADQSVSLRLQVQWASGGAAVGVPVDVSVRVSWQEETRRGTTDGEGLLVIPLSVQDRSGARIDCTCRVHGDDGHSEEVWHSVQVAAAAGEGPPAHSDRLSLALVGEAVVGTPAQLRVQGPAYGHALLVVGRSTHARVQTLGLDREGQATATVDVVATDWPRLDALVLAPGSRDEVVIEAPVRLAASVPLRLSVPDAAQPKQTVRCRANTSPGSVVTFAVVDDRIFRLVDDPTPWPDAALRPWVPEAAWQAYVSAECMDPRLLLGELLVAGRVPGPGDLRALPQPGAGGAASPATGAATRDLRSDFRATACFHTAFADAAGEAQVEFTLPDDATTWRVTATAVDARGEGGLAVATIAARLPLAAEPLLPRVLRQGDRVEASLVLDRAATAVGAQGDDAAHFEVKASGAGRIDGDAAGVRTLPCGRTAMATFALAATTPGELVVGVQAAVAAARDHSERRLPVLGTSLVQTVAQAAAGRGVIPVDAPAGCGPGAPLQVEVLAGGAAAWRELAARLAAYPYGCVEQTLSRLLPFAASSAVDGDAVLRADRIGKGMARLRQLQRGEGGPFAWWPDGEVDLAMTGLVLHGLAQLRAGGIAAADYGLHVDGDRLRAAANCDAATVPSTLSVAVVELLSGLLRCRPDDAAARQLANAIVDAKVPLPRGAALRLGLGLLAAGDRERAQRCRNGLPLAPIAGSFPGEDPVVHRAHELDLDRALGTAIDPAAEAALVHELLAASCRTYTDAVALVALAPGLRSASADLQVEVAVDAAPSQTVSLPLAAGSRAVLRIPGGGSRCVVRCRDDQQLLFVRAIGQTERSGVGPATAGPFVVERTVSGPGVGTHEDGGLVVRVGERVRVRLRLSSPVTASYVALVCPLPAGCELLGEPQSWQKFDDRVVMAWPRLAASQANTVEFDFVATMPGVVSWPAAVAEAMYDPVQQGSSVGLTLRMQRRPRMQQEAAGVAVARPRPQPVPAPATVATSEPVLPSLAEQAAAAVQCIDTLWYDEVLPGGIYGFDTEPDAEQRTQLEAALTTLAALLPRDDGAVLAALARLEMADTGRQRGAALAAWRRDLLARLHYLREQCLDRIAVRCEQLLAGISERSDIPDLLRALPAARREAVALRLLATSCSEWPGLAEDVVWTLENPIRDERLLTMLATMAAGMPALDLEIVLRRLPESRWAAWSPTVLCDLAMRVGNGDMQAQLLAVAARSAAGLRELQERARQPDWIRALSASQCPDQLLQHLPETMLAAVADDDDARAVRVLAAGPMPTATLWERLRQRGGGLPLAVVVGALRARAATVPPDFDPAAMADPTVAVLLGAFAAAADGRRAAGVFAAARPLLAAEAEVDDAVQAMVAELVVRHGAIDNVLAFTDWLTEAHWRGLWARWTPPEAVRVLQCETRIGYGLPASDDSLRALLVRAAADHDVDDAVAAVLVAPTGMERLRAVLPNLPQAVRTEVEDEVRLQAGFDLARGVAEPEPESFIADFAQLRGYTAEWPVHLLAARDRLLALRGLR